MVEYYTGTVYLWDEDDNPLEHKVLWASYEQGRPHPPEWILMEVDEKEEHECDADLWQKCEEAFGSTTLTRCYD